MSTKEALSLRVISWVCSGSVSNKILFLDIHKFNVVIFIVYYNINR